MMTDQSIYTESITDRNSYPQFTVEPPEYISRHPGVNATDSAFYKGIGKLHKIYLEEGWVFKNGSNFPNEWTSAGVCANRVQFERHLQPTKLKIDEYMAWRNACAKLHTALFRYGDEEKVGFVDATISNALVYEAAAAWRAQEVDEPEQFNIMLVEIDGSIRYYVEFSRLGDHGFGAISTCDPEEVQSLYRDEDPVALDLDTDDLDEDRICLGRQL